MDDFKAAMTRYINTAAAGAQNLKIIKINENKYTVFVRDLATYSSNFLYSVLYFLKPLYQV